MNMEYMLETEKASVKSIYTSQSEKLTQKEVINAYALICVKDRSKVTVENTYT